MDATVYEKPDPTSLIRFPELSPNHITVDDCTATAYVVFEVPFDSRV